MKTGKAAEAVLERSVLKAVNEQQEGNRKVTRAGVGKDAGLFALSQSEGHLAMSCAQHCGTEQHAASLAVFRACNSLAAAGAVPGFVTVQLTLPEAAKETEVKELMAELLEACKKAKVTLVQGHTEISSGVQAPLISVTALGTADSLECAKEGSLSEAEKQGLELVMTKYAGLAGTALLADKYHARLQARYPSFLLQKAEALYDMVSVQPEAELSKSFGVAAMHDVAEGGVFGAVWELAKREDIGLTLDLKKIPIRQETVELCEFFDINPYQLKGDGALLILTEKSARLLAALKEAGIPAAVIGMVTEGNDRIIRNEEEIRFLEPTRIEEYDQIEIFNFEN